MDGSEKLKPVLVGKSEKPRCFKHVIMKNMPVIYRHNASSWMDNKIFREWLKMLNDIFKSVNRFVIMFMDNFSGHIIDTYSNIKVVLFPANCIQSFSR